MTKTTISIRAHHQNACFQKGSIYSYTPGIMQTCTCESRKQYLQRSCLIHKHLKQKIFSIVSNTGKYSFGIKQTWIKFSWDHSLPQGIRKNYFNCLNLSSHVHHMSIGAILHVCPLYKISYKTGTQELAHSS